MSCIVAKSLSKSYGSTTAVDSIDLTVNSGKIFGFLGPNGAGKTTTIKLLTTLIAPTGGTIKILGIDA
ncbi:MAG: ATP-binding cassette domain-containing protein, partial [Nitrosopumilaceae archaeon]